MPDQRHHDYFEHDRDAVAGRYAHVQSPDEMLTIGMKAGTVADYVERLRTAALPEAACAMVEET